MTAWLLILLIPYGPVVIPGISTHQECDRLGQKVFSMETKQQQDAKSWLSRADDFYSCQEYKTAGAKP